MLKIIECQFKIYFHNNEIVGFYSSSTAPRRFPAKNGKKTNMNCNYKRSTKPSNNVITVKE